MTERILVCGSREWPGTWEDIAQHIPPCFNPRNLIIIHGGCSRFRGGVQVSVDMIVDGIARRHGYAVESYPVDHRIDGPWPGAGPRRNARMLARGIPDRGLAFGALWKYDGRMNDPDAPAGTWKGARSGGWKRTGTGDMVRRMLDARLPVRWVEAPGATAVDLVRMPEVPR